MKKLCLPLLLLWMIVYMLPEQARAQQQPQLVQLSGMVVHPDSVAPMPGVAVYVPNTTRGAITNKNGFFSLPLLPGDSVVFRMLGYQKQYIVIPENFSGQSYSTIIYLQEQSTQLPMVDVMPWATLRDLRQAVAKVELPEEPSFDTNYGTFNYSSILEAPPLDAAGNAQHAIKQQLRQLQSRYMVTNGLRLFGTSL